MGRGSVTGIDNNNFLLKDYDEKPTESENPKIEVTSNSIPVLEDRQEPR